MDYPAPRRSASPRHLVRTGLLVGHSLRVIPGRAAGRTQRKRTLSSAAHVKPKNGPPRTLVRGSSVRSVSPSVARPSARPPAGSSSARSASPSVAVRASRRFRRPSWARTPVRYLSVDAATQRPTALQGDTCWDREETPRQHENSQLAGRFRRWWQVLGSNQRRLSRRFYSTLLLFESYADDLRLCASRRDLGPPPSAIRPWTPGSGVRAVQGPCVNRPRTGTDRPTDGHGPAHGRERKRPRTGPAGAVMQTALTRIPP
jgi:hypothetical protein